MEPAHPGRFLFLDAIEHTVLSQAFIDRVLDGAFAVNPDAEHEADVQERKRLATEIGNLTTAIATGGDIPALAKALADRDRALKLLDVNLAKPVMMPDRDVLKAALELRRGQWRDVLRGPHIQQARLVLQHLIDLPIKVHNEPAPKWMTRTRPGGLLVGLYQGHNTYLIQNVASPTGFEPVSRP